MLGRLIAVCDASVVVVLILAAIASIIAAGGWSSQLQSRCGQPRPTARLGHPEGAHHPLVGDKQQLHAGPAGHNRGWDWQWG